MLLIAFLSGREPKALAYSCRGCGKRIASDACAVVVNGRPTRATYSNPAGEACEIVTVREAENLVAAEFSTEEFSWFDGYSWRPAACSTCGLHLGWTYEAVEPHLEPKVFYGLLVPALRATPDRGRDM